MNSIINDNQAHALLLLLGFNSFDELQNHIDKFIMNTGKEPTKLILPRMTVLGLDIITDPLCPVNKVYFL